LILQDHELNREDKRAELMRVIHSSAFQNARLLQKILEFVGANAIEGGAGELTEFTLAEKVFGRSPDFDPTADTTVRTSVYRLRSKLREYYAGEGKGNPVVIEIPKGHYSPVFTKRESKPLEPQSPAEANPPIKLGQSRVKGPWPIALAIVVALLFFAVLRILRPSQQTPFDLFWSPFLSATKPVIIYTGTNVVYRLPRSFLNQYTESHHVQNHGLEFPIRLDATEMGYLEPDAATFITKQDSYAGAVVSSLFTHHARAYGLRYGPDISFGDLRSGPAILIGAFNNYLTLEMTDELRFVFDHGDTIEDRSVKGRSWSARPGEDWALVSRLLSSKTGATLMAIGGIGAIGTQAAGEFVTNPQQIGDLMKKGPVDWNHKSVQLVLHTRVVDDMPGPTEVVAVYFW